MKTLWTVLLGALATATPVLAVDPFVTCLVVNRQQLKARGGRVARNIAGVVTCGVPTVENVSPSSTRLVC